MMDDCSTLPMTLDTSRGRLSTLDRLAEIPEEENSHAEIKPCALDLANLGVRAILRIDTGHYQCAGETGKE